MGLALLLMLEPLPEFAKPVVSLEASTILAYCRPIVLVERMDYKSSQIPPLDRLPPDTVFPNHILILETLPPATAMPVLFGQPWSWIFASKISALILW